MSLLLLLDPCFHPPRETLPAGTGSFPDQKSLTVVTLGSHPDVQKFKPTALRMAKA